MTAKTNVSAQENAANEALIICETDGHVGIIRLNRPKVLNALNPQLMTMLATGVL